MSFYGDGIRWWIGIVEEVGNDVPRLGRAKVRIYGVHAGSSELPTADLPYATCLVPTTEHGTSGFGANPNLMVGAQVMGMFLDGPDSQLPVIFGSIPKVELPSQEQVSEIAEVLSSDDPVAPYTGRNINDAYIQKVSMNLGSTKLARSWKFFRNTGWGPVAIAAMLGNFMVECGGTTDLIVDVEVDDRGKPAKGIAMWRSNKTGTGRYEQLDKFAESRNSTWEDLETQLRFVNHEFETQANYYDPKDFNSVTDVGHATVFFQHKYENPEFEGGLTEKELNALPEAEKEERYSEYTIYNERVFVKSHEKRRIDFATEIYKELTEKEHQNIVNEIIESQA